MSISQSFFLLDFKNKSLNMYVKKLSKIFSFHMDFSSSLTTM
jgi:hypothetical protein